MGGDGGRSEDWYKGELKVCPPLQVLCSSKTFSKGLHVEWGIGSKFQMTKGHIYPWALISTGQNFPSEDLGPLYPHFQVVHAWVHSRLPQGWQEELRLWGKTLVGCSCLNSFGVHTELATTVMAGIRDRGGQNEMNWCTRLDQYIQI